MIIDLGFSFVREQEGMELDEILQRQQHLRHLETQENGPVTPQSGYHTMERDKQIRYICLLVIYLLVN